MSRVIVVPCFNEASRLDAEAFVRAAATQPDLVLRFVDDGSRDATPEILEALAARIGADRASILRLSDNVGKAEAVRKGINEALGDDAGGRLPDAVGYWDADLSTSLDYVPDFGALLDRRPEAVAVIGSRIRLMGRHVERRPFRHYAGRVFATLASAALGFPVYDTQCGAKLFRPTEGVREAFRQPFETRWAFDVELLARLASILGRSMGEAGRVIEHPLEAWVDVPGSKVRLSHLPRMLSDLALIARRYRRASAVRDAPP